ncbi:S-adenosyl-L-methionine-dependent methyltransferase [Annulohypoxylon maeteangense]|uniref:S-adenosyl-L-methionine-dependent methyltransferase n=1 Tax=Annulohypoxylon maeteangense TaxID=1927788 RepID=UPI0020088237|nr:S-adenosyl-L-methionine-dependent methyltransferase [Annulohypoxylon maeteangense]KAI0883766.1 S-adenosyl-L-methionine-dependent methyltransferase [Annulohypoxylon maeteangense]
MNDSRVIEIASELYADAQALKQTGASDSAEAVAIRERILDSAFEIYNLSLDPAELLRTHASVDRSPFLTLTISAQPHQRSQLTRYLPIQHANLITLHFIQRFQIANIIPPDSGLTYGAIATASGQSEQTIRRILRHSIGLLIFRESPPSPSSANTTPLIHHTPASLLLRTPSFNAWIAATCEESWPAATRTVDALATFPAASEPSESGWALAHSSNRPSEPSEPSDDDASQSPPRQSLYDAIANDPARAARFAAGMAAYSSGPGYSPAHFLGARGDMLAELPAGSVFVDVGGGLGQFARAVRGSVRGARVRFVVQDLEGVVCRASSEPVDGSLGDGEGDGEGEGGIVFQAHDFFEPQPVKGAEVYFLRWILHNWSDKYALRILRNVGLAMGERSRLVIHDYCVEDLDRLSLRGRRAATNMDIGMMQLLNAQERDEKQWRELLAKADPRFRWIGVTRPPGSALAIIEASWGEE